MSVGAGYKCADWACMFRLFYTAFDWLATVFVFLAPLAVIHWLLKSFGVQGIDWFLNPLNVVFMPLDMMFDTLVNPLVPMLSFGHFQHIPNLKWAGREIPVTQGLLSFVLTFCYFVFSYAATVLKALEKGVKNTTENLQHRYVAQKREVQEKTQQRSIAEGSRVLLLLAYPFYENRVGADLFNTFGRFNGKLIQAMSHDVLLEFQKPTDALEYCMDASRALSSYYITLRPMDPQPPFKMSLHVIQKLEDTNSALGHCRIIAGYCPDNKVVLSSAAKTVLDYNGLNQTYRYFPTGIYEINGKSEDVYTLETRSVF